MSDERTDDPTYNQADSPNSDPAAIVVQEARVVDEELIEAFARLIPQLSRSNPAPDATALGEIIHDPGSMILIARDPLAANRIVGSMTLAMFRIPTGLRAWIEDVVVDEASRGRGIGQRLNEVALERARERGATTVDLTSRPSREAANRLYQRLGFERRETNVYRYQL